MRVEATASIRPTSVLQGLTSKALNSIWEVPLDDAIFPLDNDPPNFKVRASDIGLVGLM